LSSATGTNNATFSTDFDFFINEYSSVKTAPLFTLNESKSGKTIKTIVDNTALKNKLKTYNLPEKEFFELDKGNGQKLNAWMMKPTNFDSPKKYPLLMYQYSGPGSQEVANKWWNS